MRLPATPVSARTSTGWSTGVDLGTIAFTDRKGGAVRFAIANVANAKLLLTDRLIAATRPLDTSGVDEELIEDELLSKEQDA